MTMMKMQIQNEKYKRLPFLTYLIKMQNYILKDLHVSFYKDIKLLVSVLSSNVA